MEKDKRYDIVRRLINSGQIETLKDILVVIPKTTLARDLVIHHVTFAKLIADPERFILRDLYKIAELIGVDRADIVRIICNESLKEPAKKSKKSRPGKKAS